MSGVTDLEYLLRHASPVLDPAKYVIVSIDPAINNAVIASALATFREDEGLTIIVEQSIADTHELSYDGTFSRITLMVHSSLEAVGLTAAFATKLAAAKISANVFAGYYHDHIFVPERDGERARTALARLAE
ncbi:MAG: ACT domain-containing protein [Pseudomonadota bacterium]